MAVEHVPYADLPEVQAYLVEHSRKRRAAEIEVRRLGVLRWEWRFYFGRYVTGPGIVRWEEYEQGTGWTERGARRRAARRLRGLRRSDPAWSR